MTKRYHVSVRLDADTLARVEALVPPPRGNGRGKTRSSVLRELILSGLEHREPAKSDEPSDRAKATKCTG